MKVSIVGLGWYGRPLAIELLKAGHQVLGSTRELEKKMTLEEKGIEVFLLSAPSLPSPELLDTDILILNIPPSEGQLEWFEKWAFKKTPWIIFISSTSGRELLLQEEAWVQKNFDQWTILRFAGLLGADRHPGRVLSGRKNLAHRLWPVNLLHLEDAVGLTLAVLDKKVKQEIIEVCCNEHHSREDFYSEYASRMQLPLPEFDPEDLTIRAAISNQRAQQIYSFKWPTMFGKSL
jgi:nucleoside-diphosphate-sugar epimerase